MRASGKNLFLGVWLRLPSLCEYNSARIQLSQDTRLSAAIGGGGDFSNIANQSAFGAIMNATRCCKRWGMFLVLACVVFACIPVLSLPPRAVVLHSGWRFRALNDSGHTGVE